MTEIRWHGRGGQGAKTASLLLADAAFMSGKYIQSFPEYGPERSGAPITAYNRISDERCTIHSNIYDPDYVVVVDETLLDSVDVTRGLKKEGAIIINSAKSSQELRPLLKGYPGRVFTIDAGTISRKHLGAYFPNTPMLAAVVAVTKCVEPEDFLKDMEVSYRHKFARKPQVIEGNLNCLAEAMITQQPPSDKGRMLRIFYATQAGVKPPTFVLFVNDATFELYMYCVLCSCHKTDE